MDTARVAIIGLGDALPERLRRAGHQVVAGGFEPAALDAAARTLVASHGLLVTAACDHPGFAGFLTSMARAGVRIALVATTAPPGTDPSWLVQPTTSAQKVFDQAGLPVLGRASAGVNITGSPLPSAPAPRPATMGAATRRLWVVGASGGTGTTSVAVGVANLAADLDLETALVDFSDGAATFIASDGDRGLPDHAELAAAGRSALTDADDLAQARGPGLSRPRFALSATPLGGMRVGGVWAGHALAAAAGNRRLVVVDAGRPDPEGVVQTLMSADVRAGGWVLITARPGPHGVAALDRTASRLLDDGAPPDRVLACYCQVTGGPDLSAPHGWAATMLDPVEWDQRVPQLAAAGQLPPAGTTLQPLVTELLWRVTGVRPAEPAKQHRRFRR